MVSAGMVLEVDYDAGAGFNVGAPRCPTLSGLSVKFWLQPESEARDEKLCRLVVPSLVLLRRNLGPVPPTAWK